MKKYFTLQSTLWATLLIPAVFSEPCVQATEFSGSVGLEGRYYFDDAAFTNQKGEGLSLVLQSEFRHKSDNDLSVFTFVPFYRQDQKDKERTHADVRQLDLIMAKGDWEYQGGISKIFWGVTESAHLVDIINQTDGVESIDGEEKLGQPMFRVSHLHDGGSLSLFVLPYFRERTFVGKNGRLRSQLPVVSDDVSYESSKKKKHIDYALRLQHTFDKIGVGLSYFDGTSRVPDIIPDFNAEVLKQHYALVKQTGLDLQYTGEAWLWKLEAVNRDFEQRNYTAMVSGFEYTEPRVAGTRLDLGLLAEYLHDSRGEIIEAPFQNDLFLGARLVLNDMHDTEFLVGGYFDFDNQTKSIFVESSIRIEKDLKLNIEAQAFVDVDKRDPFYDLKKDGFIQLELQIYF